jgi:hypothetical protein
MEKAFLSKTESSETIKGKSDEFDNIKKSKLMFGGKT